MLHVAPFLLLSFRNALKFTLAPETAASMGELSILSEILPVAGVPQTISEIVAKSMETLESVTQADRSTFYMVDHANRVVTSLYNAGLREHIQQSFDVGIIGSVAATGEINNVAIAADDHRFYPEIDSKSGYRTKSMLTVPIVDGSGIIVAAVQLLNKRNGVPFGRKDIDCARISGAICACLLNNLLISGRGQQLQKRVDSLTSIVPDLVRNANSADFFNLAVQHLHSIIDCERVTVLLVDEAANVLLPVAFEGTQPLSPVSMEVGVAHYCLTSTNPFFVNDAAKDGRINEKEDRRLDSIESVCLAPIISPAGNGIGVVECVNKEGNDFDESDLSWVSSFGALLSNYVNYRTLAKEVNEGPVALEMDKWISPAERGRFRKPAKVEEFASLNTLTFFAVEECDWNSTFQIVYQGFDGHHLLETFHITNDQLFMLVYRTRRLYSEKVPYHNWAKIIDMFQSLLFQLERGALGSAFTPMELLALFTACLFAFAGHDGMTSEFHTRAKTPIGMLLRHDVLTTNACHNAIRILAKDTCNIFKAIPNSDLPQLWALVLQLIQHVDINTQEKVMSDCVRIQKTFDLNLEKHRHVLLIVLIKAANLTPFVRPFAISMKWQAMMMHECFAVGDAETQRGLELASKHNSREHHNKEQYQIEMITSWAMPLFTIEGELVAPLKCISEGAQDNLIKWRARL
jgi:putative methionine-R-sulfoxide reductase with GAF domain